MNEQDDLIGDLIAEVARSHGVAISRDDPIVAVVLLNQIVLRRYLEETVAPAADAIRDATTEAVRQIEQFAEAQATWLEQVSLKDRASFLEEQKALHASWKAEMEELIEGQNTALQKAVKLTAASLRVRAQMSAISTVTASTTHPPTPEQGVDDRRPFWRSRTAAMLLAASITTALGTLAWVQLTAY